MHYFIDSKSAVIKLSTFTGTLQAPLQLLETTFCITIVLLNNVYMPHTLIVCTLSLLLLLICK